MDGGFFKIEHDGRFLKEVPSKWGNHGTSASKRAVETETTGVATVVESIYELPATQEKIRELQKNIHNYWEWKKRFLVWIHLLKEIYYS